MDFQKPKQLYLLLSIVFIFILLTSFSFFSRLEGFQKEPEEPKTQVSAAVEKPVIKENTIIYKENRYLCESMIKQIPVQKDLIGLDYDGLLEYFPPEQGWEIDDSVPNVLTISREINELCALHKETYHLGLVEGNLAVFKGPLGFKDEAYLVEIKAIKIEDLPKQKKEDLILAESFKEQNLHVQQKLESALQFNNEKELESELNLLLEDLES